MWMQGYNNTHWHIYSNYLYKVSLTRLIIFRRLTTKKQFLIRSLSFPEAVGGPWALAQHLVISRLSNSQTKLHGSLVIFMFGEQYYILFMCTQTLLLTDCRAEGSGVAQQRDPAVPDPHYLAGTKIFSVDCGLHSELHQRLQAELWN